MTVCSTFPVLLQRAPNHHDTQTSSSSRFLFLRLATHRWREDDDEASISDIISVAEDLDQMPEDLEVPAGHQLVAHVYELDKRVPTITRRNHEDYKTAYACIDNAFLNAHALDLDPRYGLKDVENPGGLIVILKLRNTRSALSPVLEWIQSNTQVHTPSLSPHNSSVLSGREAIASAARMRDSPSVGARISARIRTQTSSRIDAVYNYRPLSLSALPIAVYSPVFAKFTRSMADKSMFTHEELDDANAFVEQAVAYYPTETDRVQNSRAMAKAVHPNILARSAFTLSGKTRCTPDGVVESMDKLSDFAPVLALCAVKSEIGEGSSDPAAEAECAYVTIYSSEEAKSFREFSCCPTILVAYAGPNIQILGAVFADQIIVQPLTDYISIIPRLTQGDSGHTPEAGAILRVARLFRALRISIEDLSEYYEALIERLWKPLDRYSFRSVGPPRPRIINPILQPPTLISPHFDKFSFGDSQTARLAYKERLSKKWPAKAVFRAEATMGSEVVQVIVKFTHSYSKEAHSLLADASLAPALRHCAYEEDVGMWVVVMDYIEGGADWTELSSECAESLRMAVQTLHEKNIVFGDLRTPNVLALKDRIMVIDFDWAGQVGSARYPYDIWLGAGIAWPKGVKRGGLIEKEHDLELMEKVIAGEI